MRVAAGTAAYSVNMPGVERLVLSSFICAICALCQSIIAVLTFRPAAVSALVIVAALLVSTCPEPVPP